MRASEGGEEDSVAALSSLYANRAAGKELQLDVDTAHGPVQAGAHSEVRASAVVCVQGGDAQSVHETEGGSA
jgi:hypothetical protein